MGRTRKEDLLISWIAGLILIRVAMWEDFSEWWFDSFPINAIATGIAALLLGMPVYLLLRFRAHVKENRE